MVHTRNGSIYLVQPDGCGQGRGNTKSRSVKSSSRKTHMEDARVAPIPQGLNHFQVAEIEIYQCQYRNWFRAAKEEEWEICPSLWQRAMNSYLQIKSFLGQEKTIELLGGWSPLSCKDKVKKINNWLKNQSLLSIHQKKELEMTPALETKGPVVSTSSKPAPEVSKENPKGPQKKHQSKGKGKVNWHTPYPQGYRIPKLEPSAVESVFNMARTLMEFTAKKEERMNRTFPKQ
ncbi:hypothetical protein O181_119423 [Austropuccinia psidii MF-1]|uniref:Uncharacterized protein n=1 Tax=Austropuccinia psidii MF-1 TaxID=1389203 RepID=A0A9Q3PZC5_9BASI|nr:hypothetical protein [Austropuccinia psidii MF-1]